MTADPSNSTPGALRDLAARIASVTAGEADRRRRSGAVIVESKSSPVDLVTEVDRWAETFIVGQILDARPDDAIVGEEGTSIRGTSGVEWLVDPIDGTTNFVYGHPGWSVSIAAAAQGELVAAAVCDPSHAELFAAGRGLGATRNGQTICVSATTELGRSLVATGFGYDPERRRRQAELLVELLPLVRDIRRMGSAAVDMCSVACGRVDAYFELGINAWDVAAGELIAIEAGAIVTGLVHEQARQGSVLACTPALYDALKQLVAR